MNFPRAFRSSPEHTNAMQRWLAGQNTPGSGSRSAWAVPRDQASTAPNPARPFTSNAAFAVPAQQVADPNNPEGVVPPETGPAPAVNEPMQPPALTGQPMNPMSVIAGLGPMPWANQQPVEDQRNYLFGQSNPLSAFALSTGMASRLRFR